VIYDISQSNVATEFTSGETFDYNFIKNVLLLKEFLKSLNHEVTGRRSTVLLKDELA